MILAAALISLTACRKPQAFDYRDIRNVKVENLGYDQTALVLDLVYYNPNRFGVNLKKIDCDIYIDNRYLGKYQLDTLMHIDRLAEFTLPSRIMVDMKTMFKNAATFLFNKEVLVNVKGTTRVGKAGIYATIPFNYEARHKIDLF